MLPQVFIKMHEFALTGNGKKDRDALLLKYEKFLLINKAQETVSSPQTLTQKAITDIWLDLLSHVSTQRRFSVDDDFFAMGGHSILAIRLLMLIRDKMQVQISMSELLTNPTLGGLCMLIDQRSPDPIIPLGKVRSASAQPFF